MTTTHLRLVCEARSPLRLETETYRAGSNLRGGLAQVMLRSYCAHPPVPAPPSPRRRGDGGEVAAETSACPVCWLLAANERPGQERRGYALVPPDAAATPQVFKPGERFEFGLTLFGDALKFLPYFILAVPEMGREGIGPGRGKFALKSVWAQNTLTGTRECLLAEGDNLVHTPTLTLAHEDVTAHAERLLPEIARRQSRLTIRFATPLRLIEDSHLVQAPMLEMLTARLLRRLDELAEQFAGCEPRGMEAAQALQALARRAHLVEQNTRWVDVWSGSQRRGARSPLGGLTGCATYAATPDVWQPLLPWLLWGQLVQVGKSTVKGNGVIRVT